MQGAIAIAGATFLFRRGRSESEVRDFVTNRVQLPLHHNLDFWRRRRGFSAAARNTVPVAFAALSEATDFEDAIRLAVSAGGDSDTIASMTGAMAEARWGIPPDLHDRVWAKLPTPLREVLLRFSVAPLPAGTVR